MAKDLPGDTFLGYTIYAETTWWHRLPRSARPGDGRECLMVSATSPGGGCRWEFAVEQYELGGRPTLRVALFGDAWAAFEEIPEFFASLAGSEFSYLAEVVELLDALGATDETERPVQGRTANSPNPTEGDSRG